MAADPWTTLAKAFDRDAVVLRTRAAGAGADEDVPALLLEAERLEASAIRQRELADMHGFGHTRWPAVPSGSGVDGPLDGPVPGVR